MSDANNSNLNFKQSFLKIWYLQCLTRRVEGNWS